MDEAGILQQYAKAILGQDTKAMEFLRDTAGEKPSTQVDLSTDESGLSKMSLDDLMALKEALTSADTDK